MKLSQAILVVALLVWSSTAHAVTDFLSPFSRAAEVEFASSSPTVTLQAVLDADGWLSWRSYQYVSGRPANFSPWSRRQTPPGSSSQRFFVLSGVVGIQAPSGWSGPRMYVMTAPASPPPTGFSSQLWEISWPSGPSSAASWRNVTNTGGPSVGSAPQIAVANHLGLVFVGVRTASGSLWTCRLDTASSLCSWEEERCRGSSGCHTASADSPLGMMEGAGGDLEMFVLNASSPAQIERYRWSTDNWDTLLSVPGRTIDASAFPCDSQNGESRVYATLWDGSSQGDELWVARNNGSGWRWNRLVLPEGDPPSGYAFNTHTLSVFRGRHDVIGVSSDGTELDRCRVPTSIPTWATDVYCDDVLGPSSVAGPNYFLMPEELRGGRDMLALAVFAGAHYSLIPAQLKDATYQYGLAFSPSPTVWANFLAARDPAQQFSATGNRSEFDADAFFGRVAVTSTARVSISEDDGSTYGAEAAPIAGGFQNTLGFSGDGSLYVAAHVAPSTGGKVQIARWTETSGWGSAADVPPTVNSLGVGLGVLRPWLRMDDTREHFGFLTWSRSNSGRIAYCNGSAPCDSGATAWCGSWALPSQSNCDAPGGCPSAFSGRATNQRVWVAVDSDASCPAPAVYRAVVGLRYISNLSALDSGCSAPQLSEPECYYYVPLYSGVASGRLHPANNGPPSSGWAGASGDYMVTLAGAPTSPDVALTFQHYVDVAGGPCLLASTYCRAEVTTIRRRAADFNSSAMPPLQFVVDDFRVNRDQTPSGGNLPWVDHVVPQTAYLAGDQLAVTWLDFRADPVYDVAYQFVTNDLRLDSARSGWDIWSVLESRETFWGQTGTYQQQCSTCASVRFGDSYHPARAELHGHFFVPRMVPGTTSPTIEQWVAIRSPQNPQD